MVLDCGPPAGRAPEREADAGGPTPPTAEEVFHTHATLVYNLARRLLNNETDAEDATQAVLLQVAHQAGTSATTAERTTWLYRLTLDAVRAVRRRGSPEVAQSAPPRGRSG